MPQSKEVHKEYMRKQRKRFTEGVTEEGSQPPFEAIKVTSSTRPVPGKITLSSELSPGRIDKIAEILRMRQRFGLTDDTTERWQRAVRYRNWENS